MAPVRPQLVVLGASREPVAQRLPWLFDGSASTVRDGVPDLGRLGWHFKTMSLSRRLLR